MKNFIYILCILLNFTGAAIQAQDEATDKKANPVQVKKVDIAKEPAKVEVKEIDASKEPAKDKVTLDKPEDNKTKFGSKEHRSLIQAAPSNIESTGNILFKTCLSLAAVIAVILIIFSILKKVNKRFTNVGTDNPLRIQNKMVLDSKNYLALVRVYEEELLVSIGPNGSTLLAKYALVDKEDAEGTDFENILNSQGKAVVPIDPENKINSIDLKSIRELTSGKS